MAPHQAENTILPVPSNGDHFQTAKRSGKAVVPEDNVATIGDGLDREEALTALTAEEEKKLLRRVDWRLIPLLCMLYMVKKLDESNVRHTRELGIMSGRI